MQCNLRVQKKKKKKLVLQNEEQITPLQRECSVNTSQMFTRTIKVRKGRSSLQAQVRSVSASAPCVSDHWCVTFGLTRPVPMFLALFGGRNWNNVLRLNCEASVKALGANFKWQRKRSRKVVKTSKQTVLDLHCTQTLGTKIMIISCKISVFLCGPPV